MFRHTLFFPNLLLIIIRLGSRIKTVEQVFFGNILFIFQIHEGSQGQAVGHAKVRHFHFRLLCRIRLVGDGTDEETIKEAKQLLEENGDEYLNILPWDGALTDAFPMDSGWPTSFFVDREGRIVGKLMDGAKFKDTKKRLNSYLE